MSGKSLIHFPFQCQAMPGNREEESASSLPPDAGLSLDDNKFSHASALASENQLQSTATFEILETQSDSANTSSTSSKKILTTVAEMNVDNDEDANSRVNTCNDTDDQKEGKYYFVLQAAPKMLVVAK